MATYADMDMAVDVGALIRSITSSDVEGLSSLLLSSASSLSLDPVLRRRGHNFSPPACFLGSGWVQRRRLCPSTLPKIVLLLSVVA